MKNHSQLPKIYAYFVIFIKTQFSCVIETLQIDNAIEYKYTKLFTLLSCHDITVHRSCSSTSQQIVRLNASTNTNIFLILFVLFNLYITSWPILGRSNLYHYYTINCVLTSLITKILMNGFMIKLLIMIFLESFN